MNKIQLSKFEDLNFIFNGNIVDINELKLLKQNVNIKIENTGKIEEHDFVVYKIYKYNDSDSFIVYFDLKTI